MRSGYPLDQCALYKIQRKSLLALRLNRSLGFVRARANNPSMYKVWNEAKASGGFRTIEAPREDLKAIQKRIATLLQRVLPPKFLYSPVKGQSYIDNALVHRGSREVRLLDVRDYFGNCQSEAVFRFFSSRMKCSPDVAWLLTGLTTRGGHLPQGSPCSPILSFFCCEPMWQEIDNVVKGAGCKLTVYVDDITISGEHCPEAMIYEVKKILLRHGHKHHPTKERRHTDRPAEITGVIVGPAKFSAPHRHFKKLQAARIASVTAVTEDQRLLELSRARSLESQIQQLVRLSQAGQP